MRAKQGRHMRFAAFDAARRMTPPHHAHTTFGLPSPVCASVSLV
jgi:hypothetical protein